MVEQPVEGGRTVVQIHLLRFDGRQAVREGHERTLFWSPQGSNPCAVSNFIAGYSFGN